MNSAVVLYASGWSIFICAHAFLVIRHGRLELWPDGLTNHLAGRTTGICWEQIERLVIVPTLFGRQLAADDYDGRRTVLAAPRAGLLLDDRRFHDEVEQVRMMPGGSRIQPPIFTAPALSRQARLAQLCLIALLSAAAIALLA